VPRGAGQAQMTALVVVISVVDPVAEAVNAEWRSMPAAEGHVNGAPIRRLNETTLVVRRPGRHIFDDGIDQLLPDSVRRDRPTLVFPSIHRSEQNVHSLTVHPLGNLGPRAELGGRPRTLVPTNARRMVAALRLLDEQGEALNLPATYEATHHGPTVELPAFFIEIGSGLSEAPSPEAVRVLAKVIAEMGCATESRIAVGVGGGHYVPHFTDLALHRNWAFGHLISRHALEELDPATAARAYALSEGAEGVVYSRAQDAMHPALHGLGPRLRDQDASPRTRGSRGPTTAGGRSASGT